MGCELVTFVVLKNDKEYASFVVPSVVAPAIDIDTLRPNYCSTCLSSLPTCTPTNKSYSSSSTSHNCNIAVTSKYEEGTLHERCTLIGRFAKHALVR